MTYLGTRQNEYGTTVSVHQCGTCAGEFTVCPPVPENSPGWGDCLADNCPSYDPARDADILFMSHAEIAREKPVVCLQMLRNRRLGRVTRRQQ